MSLYKDASLVMIPSAYKDGKLYSIRPTDGSGDFTFSRGSNLAATRVDVNGLIEKGRENLLLQSNQFDTTWFNSNSTETGGQAGYDGSNDAWRIDLTGAAGYISQSLSQAGIQTASVYAKAGTLNFVRFRITGTGADKLVDVNLTNGSIGTTGGGNIDAKAVSVGNDWYRISLTCDTTPSAFLLYPIQADSDFTATSGNIYIQDAQLEQGLVATDYIETGTSAAQSGILEDMPRLDYSGSCPSLLLEPSRTNLFTYSEWSGAFGTFSGTTTDNSAISPEGVVNAAKLECDGISSIGQVYLNQSISASTTYIYSVFLKAGNNNYFSVAYTNMDTTGFVSGDLSDGTIGDQTSGIYADIEPYADGWYRVSLEVVQQTTDLSGRFRVYCSYDELGNGFPTAGDANGKNIYFYGFQLEAGSYPTSYIPTYGTSQTRSQDSGVLTSLPDSLADNYTIFLELERMVPRLTNAVDMFSFYGSGSSRIRFQSHNPDYFRVRFYAADGSSSGSLYETSGDFAQGNNYKAAIVYSNGTFKCFANGSLFGTLDVVIDVSSSYLRTECIAKQVLTFPTALTDSEAIALTTL